MSFDLDALGSLLVLAWVAVAASAKLTRRRGARWAALFGAGLAALVPLDGLAFLGYVRAHLGALSGASLGLLTVGIARRLGGPGLPERRDRRALLALVLAAGAFLYPMALGLSTVDPYRWGYASKAFVAAVGLLALLSWLGRLPLTTGALVIALLGYGLALGESTNLWDYLVDPWIVVISALSHARWLARSGARPRAE